MNGHLGLAMGFESSRADRPVCSWFPHTPPGYAACLCRLHTKSGNAGGYAGGIATNPKVDPTMSALRFSPAADRNKQPILEQLQRLLPERGHALEIASGTGQHVVWFARKLTGWTWQPSDLPANDFSVNDLAGIAAAVLEAGLTNVLPALSLDVLAPDWPPAGSAFEAPFDLIYCANMLHISPWETCSGLMQGSARHLTPGGLLVLYGPYLEDDVVTSDGNQAFDKSLRASNPSWGLRNLPAVVDEAARYGFVLRERCQMPANNLLLVWTIA